MTYIPLYNPHHEAAVQRFWSYVDIRGEEDCWKWSKSTDKDGYGWFKEYYITLKAHKYSYCLVHGDPEFWVLHTCNNPPCVNPKHLYDGTPTQNSQDRDQAGNTQRGESHYRAIVTKEDVLEIRRLYKLGLTQRQLASRYGLGKSQVSNITREFSWKDI